MPSQPLTPPPGTGALRNSSRGGASGSGLPGSLLVRSGTGTGTGTGAAATGAAHTSTLAMDDAMWVGASEPFGALIAIWVGF